MTATERLRQLLDERGVKWMPSAWDAKTETFWHTSDGIGCLAIQGEVKLQVSFADYFTPEQAVEATLGRGTCDMEFTQAAQFGDPNDADSIFDVGMFRCTACGTETYGMWNDNDECREWPHYCPNCGREVVE